MHRLPAAKSWLTLPVVFVVVLGYQVAKEHFSGAQSALVMQFVGIAIAVYGAAWFFGAIGHARHEP